MQESSAERRAQEAPLSVASYATLTGRTHELKTDAAVFAETQAGRKLFEIRKDDRGYQCGDILRLRATRLTGAEMAAGEPLIYTGQEELRRVVSILRGPQYGLAEGWVIMSVVPVSELTSKGQSPAQPADGRAMDEATERQAALDGYEKRIKRVSERTSHDAGMYALGWWDRAWQATGPTPPHPRRQK